ncbi:hypothetical protein [Myxococcus eversor]|uniref:hypothetical protein n=1 Tax=Myxococcus eversor TaxID=2709661 RepID=UPI0013D19AB3|nr:hypothetical protein [Myxococcus eversor]
MRTRLVLWVSASVGWLVACQGGGVDAAAELGGGEPGVIASQPESVSGPLVRAADTVSVKRTTRFFTAVGKGEQAEGGWPVDPPVLFIPSEDGSTFTRNLGSARRGEWFFQGVPSRPYFLRTGTTYILTGEREVDIGNNRLGRMYAIYTPDAPSTYAEVHVENLAPWQPRVNNQHPGSSLQFVSRQVDVSGPIDFFEEPFAGQTSIHTDMAWASSYFGVMPMFEAAEGDKVYINQHSELSAGTLPGGTSLGYSAVVRSVETEAFNAYPGGYLPLTGVLEPLPMREVSVDWRLPEYTRHANEVHPGARGVVPVLSISPAAHGLANGWVGYSGELLNLYLPLGSSFDFSAPLRFGNPFPSDWGVAAAVTYPFRSLRPVPDDSGNAVYVRGALTSFVSIEELSAGPVAPQMTPPLSLTLDGMPAFTVRKVLSTNPVLAWSPPSVGVPSAYRVFVYEYEPSLNQPVYRSSLYVPGSVTQVRLPPDMLDPASIYYLRVSAIAAPGFDVERYPFSSWSYLPQHSAEVASTLFLTP